MRNSHKRKKGYRRLICLLLSALLALMVIPTLSVAAKGGNPGKPTDGGETAGNNLSFPVLWAEGVSKILPGTGPGVVDMLAGEWWYWWGMTGTDPNIVPLSCPPDIDDLSKCDDGVPGSATGEAPGEGWVKAYLQKDPGNIWQAGNRAWGMSPLVVDWIDWGDNLESVDWYTKSQVRTEIVLYQDLDQLAPMTEYEMCHVSGWGINEVHGLAVAQSGDVLSLDGAQATVYSPCARLTIQKLLVPRDDPDDPGEPNPVLADLLWDETNHVWIGPGLVNDAIFNLPVYAGGDGPGYYSAEINVKGKIIYGYTWNVRKLNDFTVNHGEADGDYRVTFSFDQTCGTDASGSLVTLNTYFKEGAPGTRIWLPVEEEVVVLAEEEADSGGAVGVIDYADNLTYMDVRILERTGGGTGGGNAGGGGNNANDRAGK